jgi:hypothetical protein
VVARHTVLDPDFTVEIVDKCANKVQAQALPYGFGLADRVTGLPDLPSKISDV